MTLSPFASSLGCAPLRNSSSGSSIPLSTGAANPWRTPWASGKSFCRVSKGCYRRRPKLNMGDQDHLAAPLPWAEIVRKIRARTPARIFVEQGAAYTTQMQLELRGAHARAVDAVWTEFDPQKDFPADF